MVWNRYNIHEYTFWTIFWSQLPLYLWWVWLCLVDFSYFFCFCFLIWSCLTVVWAVWNYLVSILTYLLLFAALSEPIDMWVIIFPSLLSVSLSFSLPYLCRCCHFADTANGLMSVNGLTTLKMMLLRTKYYRWEKAVAISESLIYFSMWKSISSQISILLYRTSSFE